jgi:hypothetical protein
MTTFRRLRAVLGLDKNDDPGLLQRAKAIHAALLEHADTFAAPTPALPVLLGKISVFEQATQEPERGSKGARRCGTPKRPSSCWRSLPPTAHGAMSISRSARPGRP